MTMLYVFEDGHRAVAVLAHSVESALQAAGTLSSGEHDLALLCATAGGGISLLPLEGRVLPLQILAPDDELLDYEALL